MTDLRAGDLVRRKDQTQDQTEMTVTQVSGDLAHVAWFDQDGDHTFTRIPAGELWTSVEAAKVAKTQRERAAAHAANEQAALEEARAAEEAAQEQAEAPAVTE